MLPAGYQIVTAGPEDVPLVRDIVTSHGGTLQTAAEPTAVRIFLPAVAPSPLSEAVAP